MDKPLFRSACLGAAIALLLTLIVALAAGGATGAQAPAPAATGIAAPSPTLDSVLQPAAPAQPQAAPAPAPANP